jgi:hypothetical protein
MRYGRMPLLVRRSDKVNHRGDRVITPVWALMCVCRSEADVPPGSEKSTFVREVLVDR